MKRLPPDFLIPLGLSGVIVAVAAVLVSASLRRPVLSTFVPTSALPREVGAGLDGPRLFTVDARDEASWRFFDFSIGAEIEDPDPTGWDLAFRRFHLIANGGSGFFGSGGLLDLGRVAFDSIDRVPDSGYEETESRGDSTNAAIERWYRYGWSTHVLTPKGHVYAVRTADGRYAKMEIVSYYCPGAVPGCLTIRYAYQGDGSPRVASPVTSGPGSP